MSHQATDQEMEELGGVIFTKLLEASELLSLEDLCANTAGLRSRTSLVKVALRNLCDEGLAVVSDNKFCLKDRLPEFETSQAGSKFGFIGAVGGNSNNSGQGLPMATTGSAVGHEALRNAPPTRESYKDIVEQGSPKRPLGNQGTDVAVRTNSAIVSSMNKTSGSMAVVGSEKDKNFGILAKIVQYLKAQPKPVKAHVVAKGIKIGTVGSDVNRYLYCLMNNNVIEQIGAEWKMNGNSNVTEGELLSYAGVLSGKSKSMTETDGGCPCPKRGPSCTHIKNIVNNQYNIHIGDTIVKSDVTPVDLILLNARFYMWLVVALFAYSGFMFRRHFLETENTIKAESVVPD